MRDYERVAIAINNAIEVAKEEFGEASQWLIGNCAGPNAEIEAQFYNVEFGAEPDAYLEDGFELETECELSGLYVRHQGGVKFLVLGEEYV